MSPKLKNQLDKKTPVKKIPAVKKEAVVRSKKGNVLEVYNLQGKVIESMEISKDIFGQKPNMALLSQAVRVYESKKHPHNVATKTRSNVRGGGAKPWRQKGTGRARAGSIRSPLWVGGGVSLGPTPGKRELTLPKKMKRKALIYALSLKKSRNEIKVIANVEKLEPKTKNARQLFSKMQVSGPSVIITTSDQKNNLKLATKNIKTVLLERVDDLNAYKVLSVKNVLFSKEALQKFT